MNSESRHVLLVEADEVLGDAMMRKLIESGYAATWEKSAPDGLRRARLIHPALILLDISGSGVETTVSDIRKDSDLVSVPIIVLSNSGDAEEIKKLLAAGATDYVVKADFNPSTIVSHIATYLTGGDAPKPSSAEKRILIVEDDEVLSSLSTMRFKKAGYQVALATDGNECLEALSHDPLPDIVLLDIIMPGANGFDVLRAMKRDPRLSKVPVVIFSNFAQEHELDMARDLGATEFFVKSKMTLREVVERISEMLR